MSSLCSAPAPAAPLGQQWADAGPEPAPAGASRVDRATQTDGSGSACDGGCAQRIQQLAQQLEESRSSHRRLLERFMKLRATVAGATGQPVSVLQLPPSPADMEEQSESEGGFNGEVKQEADSEDSSSVSAGSQHSGDWHMIASADGDALRLLQLSVASDQQDDGSDIKQELGDPDGARSPCVAVGVDCDIIAQVDESGTILAGVGSSPDSDGHTLQEIGAVAPPRSDPPAGSPPFPGLLPGPGYGPAGTRSLSRAGAGTGTPRPLRHGCLECGKAFGDAYKLTRHMRTHTGARPFPCRQCGRAFSQESHLRTHQRLHTGLKPFACPQCGRRFAHRHHLRTHTRIHTGERPYQCGLCGKKFGRNGHLQRHSRTHTRPQPPACGACGLVLAQPGDLSIHRCAGPGRAAVQPLPQPQPQSLPQSQLQPQLQPQPQPQPQPIPTQAALPLPPAPPQAT